MQSPARIRQLYPVLHRVLRAPKLCVAKLQPGNTSTRRRRATASLILAEQFDAEEGKLFEAVMRPEVESRRALVTERVAYLSARRPPG